MNHKPNTCPDRYLVGSKLTCPHAADKPTAVIL